MIYWTHKLLQLNFKLELFTGIIPAGPNLLLGWVQNMSKDADDSRLS